jgi:hypothetical protein
MEIDFYNISTTKFMYLILETFRKLSTDSMNFDKIKIDQQTSSLIFEKIVKNLSQWLKTHLHNRPIYLTSRLFSRTGNHLREIIYD